MGPTTSFAAFLDGMLQPAIPVTPTTPATLAHYTWLRIQ